MVTYDVWFNDDGKWRLDVRNVRAPRAQETLEANRRAGYEAVILPHDPDRTQYDGPSKLVK